MNTYSNLEPAGVCLVKRKLTIPLLLQMKDARRIKATLAEIQGIHGVIPNLENHSLLVHYDPVVTNYETIALCLKNIAYPLSENLWNHFKRSLYQYTDTNARDSAKAPPSSCCNRPPKQR